MFRDETLQKIELPPGIYKNGTQYQIKGRWFDGNLIRWVEGQLRPVGGWQRVSTSAVAGKARDMQSWADNSGDRWMAIGTSSNLYVTRGDGTQYDITPVGYTVGNDDAVEALGYGGGNYGADTYGTPRSGGTYLPLAMWSLDTWGEYLVSCARNDGKIYQWTLNTASVAAVLSNAPVDCVGILVTDQRHMLALGAGGDGRRVEWCDKEDNNIWTPAADNEAGGINLQARSAIKSGVKVRGNNLILTSTDAHAVTFVGAPFIYGRERIGEDCGLVAAGALISYGERAVWMGNGSFWQSDGVTVAPLDCDVASHVFGSINRIQIEKVVAGHNPDFGEVTWFYPSNDSNEPDLYVTYNYREEWWSIGEMARTCWDGGAIYGFPHAMGTDGHLYRHEDEWTDNGASRFASIFAETGALEIGNGARVGLVDGIITDEETLGEATLTFRARMAPNDPTEYTYGPYAVRTDGIMDARFSARQAFMRVVPTVDQSFSIGALRLNAKPGGRR